MNNLIRNILLKGVVVGMLLLGTILCFGAQSVSDDFTDRRLTAGAKIFRALMAADANIEEKKNQEGQLLLCLVFDDDERNAKLVADTLHSRTETRIRGIEISPDFIPYSELVAGKHTHCTGIFLTQEFSDDKLAELIVFARDNKVILFSPFEGDVERGVFGGIKVESRVQPYVNVSAIRDARITLKAFFMKVTKTYEE